MTEMKPTYRFAPACMTTLAPRAAAGVMLFWLVAAQSTAAERAQSAPAASDDSWESRAIVGFHQSGASASDFSQNFFFDFFIMRPLEDNKEVWDAKLNLWGNLRVASTPQQITSTVAEFAKNFSNELGKLKVNELAQSAEFQSGLEWRIRTFTQGERKRMLGLIGFVGATGAFSAPAKNVSIFEVPERGSSQYARFLAEFPTAASSRYVGFVTPDRDRFYRQYGMGVRLSTFHTQSKYAPPATYSMTLGQDEAVTGGRFRSVVGRIDVFYPLPIGSDPDGKWRFVYLFGTADLRLSKAKNITPLILKEAPSVSGFDPQVTLVTTPSNRDTYRLGVGMDVLNFIRSLR